MGGEQSTREIVKYLTTSYNFECLTIANCEFFSKQLLQSQSALLLHVYMRMHKPFTRMQ